ncbi:hypothetical protein ACFU96_48370 [Streptomyces sp. NPDC057620]|uniref:hypothetical protein n=1 Tax=Streptomyces sp. NPDC057620 TaxID=3346185 RepID=UPI00368AD637
MSTTTTETLKQEYDRLCDEEDELRTAARKDGWSEQAKERQRAISLRLREILTIPPAGYALPAAASGLIAHAEAHGWLALAQWTSIDFDGDPFVTVQVGRQLADGEMPDARGSRWLYKLTWHSRDCAPGKVRLFGNGHAVTPDSPGGNYAPSVKAIRAVIEQHPAVTP